MPVRQQCLFFVSLWLFRLGPVRCQSRLVASLPPPFLSSSLLELELTSLEKLSPPKIPPLHPRLCACLCVFVLPSFPCSVSSYVVSVPCVFWFLYLCSELLLLLLLCVFCTSVLLCCVHGVCVCLGVRLSLSLSLSFLCLFPLLMKTCFCCLLNASSAC